MSLAAFSHLNVWWIGELLNALLRPMYIRWMVAKNANQRIQATRFEHFFVGLLHRADCYPYLVSQDANGLLILTGTAAQEYRELLDSEDDR